MADVVNRRMALREMALLFALCGFLFFFGLGAFGLVGADEPRYAQIAREMLQRHDLVTPILDGKPWLEKPPLYYWGAMLSYSIFGVHDWSARLPSALFSSALVLFVYFFARHFRPQIRMEAAVCAASCAAVLGYARSASTDMMLSAPFAMGMLCWWGWLQTGRRPWLYGFYLLMALAALAKGPVAPFLAGLIIVVFSAMVGDLRRAVRSLHSGGIALFLLCGLPWYLAVQIRNPVFFRFFVLEHNLSRFGTNLYQHRQPFWYYLPVLLLALTPWAAPAIAGLRAAALQCWRREAKADEFPLYLLAWGALPLIFFSLSHSKLPGYILPAVPAFVLLAAEYLDGRRQSRALQAVHLLVVAAIAALPVLVPALLLRQRQILRIEAPRAAIIAAAVFLFGYWLLRARGESFLRVVTIAPVIVAAGLLLKSDAGLIDNAYSARPIAVQIQSLARSVEVGEVAVLGAKRDVEYGLDFYRNEKTSRYERGEVPAAAHLVIVAAGFEGELAKWLDGRGWIQAGEFKPRNLVYYRVNAAKAGRRGK